MGDALPGSESAALAERTWPVPWEPVWGTENGLSARIGTGALRAALAAAVRLPDSPLSALLGSLAAIAARVDRRRSEAARVFLRQAFGELPREELERRTRQAWLHLLRVTVDTERLFQRVPAERAREHFDVEACGDLREVLRQRRGCIFVSAHLGNWEAGISLTPWIGFHPVYGVARPAKNMALSRAMQASRERRGIRVLNRKGAMRSAPAILRAGGAIGLVVDQRASGRALLVPFFGRLARCDRSPAVLMKRFRVPIVVSSCLLGDRPLRYRQTFHEVLWPEEWAGAEVEAIARRINESLERMIRAHPEQYVWIHDRYRDTPEDLAPGGGARILRR